MNRNRLSLLALSPSPSPASRLIILKAKFRKETQSNVSVKTFGQHVFGTNTLNKIYKNPKPLTLKP